MGSSQLTSAQLPPPRQILAWMYAGRLAVAAVTFLAVVLVWRRADPDTTLAASLVMVLTGVLTGISFWYSHLARRPLNRDFLYLQSVFDAILVTAVVHLTGGAESAFAPLYILVICSASILLPLRGGILVAAFASALYFTDVALSTQSTFHGGVLLQIGVFATVALLTGYLGVRLRETGTALGEVETQLRLLQLDSDQILSSIASGVLTVDGTRCLVYINPIASRLLSLPAGEWVGKPIIAALNEAAPGLGWVIEHSAKEKRAIARFEAGDLLHETIVLGVSTAVLGNSDTSPPTITAIFQDITEKKRLDALERRTERLEAVAELSASLAHEIKNPLASVRSAVEQLAEESVDPEDRSLLKRLVVQESNRLTRLLAEFIDFARVRVVTPVPVNISAVVHNAVTLVRSHPDAEGRTFLFKGLDGSGELWVNGAPDLLHQAVINLVLNGAQWAGSGGRVDVSLDLADTNLKPSAAGAGDMIRLRVSDSGPGIDPDIEERIFDPFVTHRPGGTGLGLALVQRAVDVHGGVILVNNDQVSGCPGASFSLYLPLIPVPLSEIELPAVEEEVLL